MQSPELEFLKISRAIEAARRAASRSPLPAGSGVVQWVGRQARNRHRPQVASRPPTPRRRLRGFTAFCDGMLNQPASDHGGTEAFTRRAGLSHRDSKFFDLGEEGSHVGVGRLRVDVVSLDDAADDRVDAHRLP